MSKANTEKLFVNLSASQVRKRLKGHGFGVRRVEAVGRNQAVIIHTATGTHCRELSALFADAGATAAGEESSTPIANLRNLGPASAAWLRDVGISSKSDLQRLGPVLVFRLVKQRHPGVSWSLLWAMEASLQDKDWRELDEATKARLRHQAEAD